MSESLPHVAVIGGGISGLHAADLLTGRGHRVTIIEARDRFGGRLLSTPSGLDLGASWFWPGERRVARLVDELGIAVHEQHRVGDAMYDDASRTVRLDGNPVDVASFRFTDGADSLTHALARRLTARNHSDIRLNSHVHTVHVDPESTTIALDGPAGGELLDTDHVVLALPPALAVAAIEFLPTLPADLRAVAERTPVWMGAITKVVARYATAFWRHAGLAGSAVSHRGPLREIHDLSGPGGNPAALFGFAPTSASAGGVSRGDVCDQLGRLFGPEAAAPLELHLADWRTEQYTSPSAVEHLTDYSTFGHRAFTRPTSGGRIHWISTETAPVAAGHIEGALAAAERAVEQIAAHGHTAQRSHADISTPSTHDPTGTRP